MNAVLPSLAAASFCAPHASSSSTHSRWLAIMIDYLEGLKGAGRTKTLQDAEKLLAESADAAEADAEGPAAQKSERASQVITVLQRPEQ